MQPAAGAGVGAARSQPAALLDLPCCTFSTFLFETGNGPPIPLKSQITPVRCRPFSPLSPFPFESETGCGRLSNLRSEISDRPGGQSLATLPNLVRCRPFPPLFTVSRERKTARAPLQSQISNLRSLQVRCRPFPRYSRFFSKLRKRAAPIDPSFVVYQTIELSKTWPCLATLPNFAAPESPRASYARSIPPGGSFRLLCNLLRRQYRLQIELLRHAVDTHTR